MKRLRDNQAGFTIVELLIATGIFATILLGATFSLLQISKMYYKGVISSRTQEATRNVIDNVTRPIQLEGESPSPPVTSGTQGVFCIGSYRYSYIINRQVGGSGADAIQHALWRDKITSDVPRATACGTLLDLNTFDPTAAANSHGTDGEDLLGDSMRLKQFTIAPVGGPDVTSWSVEVAVLYGDRDLMSPDTGDPDTCKGGIAGSQWCALAQYSTQVTKRIR